METLEELKAIIAGKPEGAQFYDADDREYIKFNGRVPMFHNVRGWHMFKCPCKLRSLSDIERIIELMETLESFKNESIETKSANCAHDGGWIARWDYGTCTECKCVKVGTNWGVASRKWFKNLEEAKFYKKNGALPK